MIQFNSKNEITDVIFFKDKDSVKFSGGGLVVNDHGFGNKIIIGQGVVFNNFKINLESNFNEIKFSANTRLTGVSIMKITDGNKLYVGANTTIGGASFICGEGSSIKIGENCMLAWDIEFRSTDSHAIFDLATRQRINPAKDITIEDNVWIGAHTKILKGSYVSEGSIVSLGALVVKKIMQKNVILAGVPAQIIRENVYWERPLLG